MNFKWEPSKINVLNFIVIAVAFIAANTIGAMFTPVFFLGNANKTEYIAIEFNVKLVENAILQCMKIKINLGAFSKMLIY